MRRTEWKWPVEESYAGPATAAWAWIAAAIVVWGVMVWLKLR